MSGGLELQRQNNRTFLYRIAFSFLVASYALLIVVGSELGPSDEFAFLPTLQSGKAFPHYNQDFPYFDPYEMGRFVPLGGQEYNLVALFTNKPWAYFSLNAFEFAFFAFLLLKILERYSKNQLLNYSSITLLLFVPGVTLTFFKLLYIEKNLVFLLAVFFVSYLSFIKEQRLLSLILALCSANLAMYYKETVFSVIAVFALVHLYFSWKKSTIGARFLDILLITSSIIYIILYLILVFPHRGEIIYNQSIYNPILVFVKNLLNYGLFSDPLPMLLIPLSMMRLYQIFVKKWEAHPFLDSLVAAGATYIAAYLTLNIYSPYYLLPAYLCVLPPLLYFYQERYLCSKFWKAYLIIVCVAFVTNTIPSGIHYLTYNKYQPLNFNETIDYLVADINHRYNGKRVDIFIDGVDRGTGQGVYLVFGEFLKYKGLSILKFDLKSNVEAVDKRTFVWKQSPFDKESDLDKLGIQQKYPRHPFTVFQKNSLQTIASGDYLIVSPHSTKNVDQNYIESLARDYQLMYKTDSRFAVPDLNLKAIIKYIISQMSWSSYEDSGMLVNRNIMNWPDYYVFVRR
jgi:hypothetical protein